MIKRLAILSLQLGSACVVAWGLSVLALAAMFPGVIRL